MKIGYQGLTKSEKRSFIKEVKYEEELKEALQDIESIINPWCINVDGTLCSVLINGTPYCCDNCMRKQNWLRNDGNAKN